MTTETPVFCSDCGRELELCDWDGIGDLCEKCEQENAAIEWIDSTETKVRELAAEHGWDFERTGGTGSRYYELTRNNGLDDDEQEWQAIKLRISDHATAYCSEDISLTKDGSGDDHTLDSLKNALAR